jgi:hypothetical protein
MPMFGLDKTHIEQWRLWFRLIERNDFDIGQSVAGRTCQVLQSFGFVFQVLEMIDSYGLRNQEQVNYVAQQSSETCNAAPSMWCPGQDDTSHGCEESRVM